VNLEHIKFQNKLFIEKQPVTLSDYLMPVIFNVGEIATQGGDFMRCGGDFVIYVIWGGFQFPGGKFLQHTQMLNWFQKTFATLESKHLIHFRPHGSYQR